MSKFKVGDKVELTADQWIPIDEKHLVLDKGVQGVVEDGDRLFVRIPIVHGISVVVYVSGSYLKKVEPKDKGLGSLKQVPSHWEGHWVKDCPDPIYRRVKPLVKLGGHARIVRADPDTTILKGDLW